MTPEPTAPGRRRVCEAGRVDLLPAGEPVALRILHPVTCSIAVPVHDGRPGTQLDPHLPLRTTRGRAAPRKKRPRGAERHPVGEARPRLAKMSRGEPRGGRPGARAARSCAGRERGDEREGRGREAARGTFTPVPRAPRRRPSRHRRGPARFRVRSRTPRGDRHRRPQRTSRRRTPPRPTSAAADPRW
jgi:hypothetical protein